VPADLVSANSAFAVDLYGALAKSPGNLVFSPFSVSTAFAMAREGARGETAAQMDRALHVPAGMGTKFADLLDTLNSPRYTTRPGPGGREEKIRTYELAVANGLFGDDDWPIHDAYRRTIADAFGGELTTLDFGRSEPARVAINRWVEGKTRARIRDLVPPGQITQATKLVLANAVYFKAAWHREFSTHATIDGPFHSPGGDVKARLMRDTDTFAYAETPDLQVIEIPYLNGDASMFVVLPRANDGLPALEKALTPAALDGWLRSLSGEEVELTLPRWRHTVATDLGGAMKGLGMALAFDELKADFTGIAPKPSLYITSALHQAFISVDEEGTEAAAATALVMAPTAAAPGAQRKPKTFLADHPFLYGIRDRATKTVLFLGRVVDPTK
jgi:serpin B